MNGRTQGWDRGAGDSATSTFVRRIDGVAVGVAVGFVCYAALVPLGNVSYYLGAPDEKGAFEAASRAGLLWLLCTVLGAVCGLALAFFAGAGERARAVLGRSAVVSLAAYLLCLRGAWGRVARELATAPEGLARPMDLPAAAWALPLLASILGGTVLWAASRRPRGSPPPPSPRLIGLHMLSSFAAAIMTVQLAYYVSRTPAFVRGLGRVAAFLVGR